jgi:hypothetical protein
MTFQRQHHPRVNSTREHKDPGTCQEPGCCLPALYCAQHGPAAHELLQARAVIEDVVRDLEFDGPVRWAAIIERLRGVL